LTFAVEREVNMACLFQTRIWNINPSKVINLNFFKVQTDAFDELPLTKFKALANVFWRVNFFFKISDESKLCHEPLKNLSMLTWGMTMSSVRIFFELDVIWKHSNLLVY